MDRRSFLSRGGVATGVLVLTPSILLEGCISSSVINLINTVLDAATNVLKVVEPNAPWAASFAAAVQALKTAEATWQNGGTVNIVDDALNTLLAIADAIPFTAIYAPLIAVLVAGIEMVLGALPVATTASLKSRNTLSLSPYKGRVSINVGFFETKAGAFKREWNGTAKSNPALAAAVI